MNRKTVVSISFVSLLFLILVGVLWFERMQEKPRVTVAEETIKSEVVSSTSYKDLIKDVVVTDIENRLSPYVETISVTGKARGTWFFEGSFPAELLDANGVVMKTAIAKADGEWMTENFVPFSVSIDYALGTTRTGFVVLKKDNPSDDPAQDDAFKIPVTFSGVQ